MGHFTPWRQQILFFFRAFLKIMILKWKIVGVRFWIEKSTKCQILNLKNATRQILNFKFFDLSDFEKNVCIPKNTFWFILLPENDIFYISSAFLESVILNWKFY